MKSSNQKFEVKSNNSGQRLDLFLAEMLGETRSQTQKYIEEDRVQVNGKLPKKAGDRIKTDDTVVILTRPKAGKDPLRSKERDSSVAVKLPQNDSVVFEPEIIAETKDYIVINKPSGLLVHPTMAHEKNTLVSWLVKKYPSIKKVGDDPTVRPGIVHRLDKEASGLMVVARTQKMFEHLKEQFKNRTIQKEYFALAHGKIVKDWDEITFPIARSETFDRMAARPLLASKNVGSRQWSDEENEPSDEISPTKDARTEFLIEKRFVNCTLLHVILHTGRMHQIRVHMLAYNHPLVGDPLYFQKKRKRNLDEKCGRLFLHSVSLAFVDLEGDRRSFESPLPDKLQSFLLSLH